jgi:hypothetical protein
MDSPGTIESARYLAIEQGKEVAHLICLNPRAPATRQRHDFFAVDSAGLVTIKQLKHLPTTTTTITTTTNTTTTTTTYLRAARRQPDVI